MKKRIISLICVFSILVSCFSVLGPFKCFATSTNEGNSTDSVVENQPLMLWYDEEAPYGEEDTYKGQPKNPDDGWERWSIPLGNGYFGANVFGRTNSERIQLSEKTLSNVYYTSKDTGGWNNFSETYIDFGHPFESVTDYSRALDLNTAISTVDYVYDGVKYSREYLTSYEDYCMVIKLTADKAGKLSFTLRPTIPYLQDFAYHQGNPANTAYYEVTKHGNVTSKVDENGAVVNLSGHMGQFGIDFEAEYRVFTDGDVEAGTWTHTYNTNVVADVVDEFNSGIRDADAQTLTVTNGTLEISNATEAYIVICLGTNYDQSKGAENSPIFTTGAYDQKLDASGVDAKDANDARMAAALDNSFNNAATLADGYKALRDRHVADYSGLFGRASFDLVIDEDDLNRTTDQLLERYKNDQGNGHYLEMLIFQYGRYLMVASSRETSLPSNLQGAWNRYNYSSWGAGMWHNINEQMNYWAAFSTNLTECFESYVNLTDAYLEKARSYAASILKAPPFNYTGKDTGIAMAIGVTPYIYGSADSGKNAGNLGLTTQMFWDYYKFTADETILADTVYPLLYEAAQFITKTVAYNESEDAYLSIYSDSPEQKVDGVWYYTEGTTYSQSYAYLNNKHLLEAASILGYPDDELLTEVRRQLDKYDAILVGLSGQVKEFREEDYYGDLGEYEHRHVSQLLGLYPGEIINAETDAWIDAAKVTLTERGDFASVGWARALAISLWARTGSAEEAHDVLSDLIKINTATNLWNLINMNERGFFQVDGSFGATAGITEMLLQSHNGYIEPLAAIPESWSSGSYSGFVARGNFTVGAKWYNGSATKITVLSGGGGECIIHLAGISDARVVDSTGKQVAYISDKLDYIRFDTTAGETYTITEISKVQKIDPASDLAVMQMSKNDYALSWSASNNAVSYNVYKAIGDAPSYTLIDNVTKCNYTYTTSASEENIRTTYRVTAVDEDGRESDGVLCYVNPLDTEITDIQATKLIDGSLQVLICSVADINVYTLYKYDSSTGGWCVVEESTYPLIVHSDYDEEQRYAVSVTSGYFPSELREIKEVSLVGGYTAVYEEDTSINVFEGVTEADLAYSSTISSLSLYAAYPLIKAFDGDTTSSSSRWATRSVQNESYSVTVTLKEKQVVKTLMLYDFRNSGETGTRSDQTMVEVYNDGEWITVLEGVALNRAEGKKYCELDLGFVEAEKIRMTFKNTQSSACATIYEVVATGAKVTYVTSDEEPELIENTDRNIFEGVEESDLTFSSSAGLTLHASYPLIYAFDGDTSSNFSRWSPSKQMQNAPYTVTITLDKVELVKKLRLYDYRNYNETGSRSDNTKVEVYFEGEWTTVLEGVVLDRVPGTKYCELDLGFAAAEKIRITFENTKAASCATIYEVTGTSAKVFSSDRTGLLDAIIAADAIDLSKLDLISKSAVTGAYNNAMAVLCNIDSASAELSAAESALYSAIDSVILSDDRDLGVTEDLKNGSGYPTTANDNITNVGGIGGKVEDDLAYKMNGDVVFNFNFTRPTASFGTDFVLEFNILLEEGSKFTMSNKIITTYANGSLGEAAWGGPGFIFDGKNVSVTNATITAIDGEPVKGGAVACDMQYGEWYKVAIVMPITLGKLTRQIYLVVNGTVYTMDVKTPFYGLAYPQFRKETADGPAIYLDNIVQKNGASAIYTETRDALNDLSVFNSDELEVKDGLIYTAKKISAGELKALVNGNIRVFTDSTLKKEVSDFDCLNGGEVVVAYASNGRKYERTYNYYVMAQAPDGYIVASFYDGGERVANMAVAEGQIPTAPAVSEVIAINGVGYRFIGWTDTEGSDVVTELGPITADASYYTVRVPVTYKVEKADGSVIWYSESMSLSEIISNSASGDVITACADVDIDSVIYLDKSITLDLGGNKLTTTSYIVPSYGAYVTIRNGTVDVTVREVAQMSETRSAEATLVLRNITLTKGADAANKYIIDSRAGSVLMDKVTVNEGEWNIPASSPAAFITVGYKTAKVAQSIKFTFKDCNITLPKTTLITGTGATGETNGYSLDIDVVDSYISAGSYVLNLQPVSTAMDNCWLDISIDGKSTMLTSSGFTNQVMFKLNPAMNGEQVVVWANYGVVLSKLPRLAVGKVILGDGDAMLEYDEETTLGYVKDVWADGYTPIDESDYEYSFCVIGDTQMTVNYDPTYTNILFDWIINNKDSKNIQYVFHMGDITNHSTDTEWSVAYNEITKLDGVVDYSLLRGNHDTSEGLNATFNNEAYKSMFDGFFSEDLIENAYVTFTVGDVKYLHLTLDCGASDAVLSWANGVISKYYDHRVIISTHSYLDAAGELITERASGYGTSNSGEQMWNKLISKHENIFLVLAGHVFAPELICVQSKGDHGNVITQLVTNGQTYDYRNGAMGLVSMLYFSKDGKTVTVEYYSTVYDKYLGPNSQFTITVPEYAPEEPETPEYLYSVTHISGIVNYYDSSYALSDIMTTYASSGCIINVYGDVSIDTDFKVPHHLSLNLNGHTLTSDGGSIQGGNTPFSITNGKISVTNKNVFYIAEGYPNTVINLSHVEISHTTAAGAVSFADVRNGTLNLDNVIVARGAWNNVTASFISAGCRTSAASQPIYLSIRNSSIDLGSNAAKLVEFTGESSQTLGWSGNLTVANSTITLGTGCLVYAKPASSASEKCKLNVIFDGRSVIIATNFFDISSAMSAENISITFAIGAKLSSVPTAEGFTVSYPDGALNYDSDLGMYVVTSMANIGCMLVDASGNVVSYYDSLSFTQELVELAQKAGYTIVLLRDMEVPNGTGTGSGLYNLIAATLVVDLNGHTLTIPSYARFGSDKNTNLTIKNGTVIHAYNAYYSYSGDSSKTTFTAENVTFINTSTSYATFDHRIGNLILINCQIDFSKTTSSAVSIFSLGYVNNATNSLKIYMSGCTVNAIAPARTVFKLYGGRPTTIEIEDCTFNLGVSAYIVHAAGSYVTEPADVVKMSGCEINKSGETSGLFCLEYDDITITLEEIHVIGGADYKSDKGTVELSAGQSVITTEDGYKITAPKVELEVSLTLYTDFTLNIWIPADTPIISINVNGTEYQLSELRIVDGKYLLPIGSIQASSAADNLDVQVIYVIGGETKRLTKTYSVVKYASAILNSDKYADELKSLLVYTLSYIESVYVYAEKEIPEELSSILLSDAYLAAKGSDTTDGVIEVPATTTDSGNANKAVYSAKLALDTSVRVIFTLASDYSGELILTYGDESCVYNVVNGVVDGADYVEIDMHTYKLYKEVIYIRAGEYSGTYDLAAYVRGAKALYGDDDVLNLMLLELYNYCKEASEYKAFVDLNSGA